MTHESLFKLHLFLMDGGLVFVATPATSGNCSPLGFPSSCIASPIPSYETTSYETWDDILRGNLLWNNLLWDYILWDNLRWDNVLVTKWLPSKEMCQNLCRKRQAHMR